MSPRRVSPGSPRPSRCSKACCAATVSPSPATTTRWSTIVPGRRPRNARAHQSSSEAVHRRSCESLLDVPTPCRFRASVLVEPTPGSSKHQVSRPEVVDERVALVRKASGGHDIELHALVQRVILTDDPRTAAEKVQQSLPQLSTGEILASPYLWIGSAESIGDDLLAARERWGFSYFTVLQDSLRVIEQIIACLGDQRATS